MLGDDPDPTVTTNRVGYGTTFGRARGGGWLCRESQTVRQERIENPVRLRMVDERKGRHGNYERMKVLKTMTATSADAMRMMP